MGLRGPPKVPLEVLIARGSRHAKGRVAEPPPPPPNVAKRRTPIKPGWLTAKASAFWDEKLPEFIALGIISGADDDTVGRYCQTFVDWHDSSNKLREEGPTITNRFGEEKPNPRMMHVQQLSRAIHHLEEALGLSPAARLKLHINIIPPPEAKPVVAGKPNPGVVGGERFFKTG